MKQYFNHIRYKYNKETAQSIKNYCRNIDKLAKSIERSKFLVQCRKTGLIPKHLKNSTQKIKHLFKSNKAQAEINTITKNLHKKILNVEISDTHTSTTTLKREIERIEKQLLNTLNETELTNLKIGQWSRYANTKQKIRRIHSSKLEKLRAEKFKEFNFKFNENWFQNFTNVDFDTESKWLLSLGNKFALPVSKENFSPISLIADMEQWVQNIKDDNEKDILRSKIANRISNFKRNSRINEKEKFILAIYEKTKEMVQKHKDKIIITSADKGNKTVIMYKEEYNKKMLELLQDKTTFKCIREDPTEKLQKTNNNILSELLKGQHITKSEKSRLTAHAAAAPELYGLPKIHKENMPLRPISSSTKVPCYHMAKYIGGILKNIISPTYNIKNSWELKEKLCDIALDENDIIVSFDVVSLFTNIPTHLAIKNILDKWDILKRHTTISKQKFLKILQFCLKDNNYFTYNGKYYHQIYGMPMGNPLSPTIADIVLDALLDEVIKDLKTEKINIKFITKYVDDLFAVIKQDDMEIILKALNSYHKKIQFTVEKENDKKIPYLDITIIKENGKLITNWYAKGIASGRLINFHSTQPMSMKTNTATNLINKILNISDKRFRNENISKIRKIMNQNSYPTQITNNLINKILRKQSNTNTKNQSTERVFYSVPYVPKLTETKTLKHMINDDKTYIAYTSNKTLRHLFTREKPKIDKMKADNVVYEITCQGNESEMCNKVYIGTTKRMLGTRIAEHKSDVNKGKKTTALAQHVQETGHKPDFNGVKIVDREKKVNKRFTLESLRIQQRIKKAINTKEDKDNIKLQYSIAIS